MRNFKVFIVVVVIISAVLSLLYLSLIALRIQRYAFSFNTFNLILYSKKGSYKIDYCIEYVKDKIRNDNVNVKVLYEDENSDKELIKILKSNPNYIILKIDEDKILSRNTILIFADRENSKEQRRAQKIKVYLTSKNINCSIITDTKENLTGYNIIRLQIPQNLNKYTAGDAVLKAVYALLE